MSNTTLFGSPGAGWDKNGRATINPILEMRTPMGHGEVISSVRMRAN